MKRALIILSIAVLAASCAKSVTESYGEASFALTQEESVAVVVSKASVAVNPDLFTLEVSGTDISGIYSQYKGRIVKMTAGSHTASAWSCTPEQAEEGNGRARWFGSADFVVEPMALTEGVTVNCKVANCKFTVSLSDSFEQIFDPSYTTVTLAKDAAFSDRPLVAWSIDAAPQLWYNAGADIYMKMTARRRDASQTVTYISKSPLKAVADTWNKIEVSFSESSLGGITFSVSGADTTVSDAFDIDSYTEGALSEDE